MLHAGFLPHLEHQQLIATVVIRSNHENNEFCILPPTPTTCLLSGHKKQFLQKRRRRAARNCCLCGGGRAPGVFLNYIDARGPSGCPQLPRLLLQISGLQDEVGASQNLGSLLVGPVIRNECIEYMGNPLLVNFLTTKQPLLFIAVCFGRLHVSPLASVYTVTCACFEFGVSRLGSVCLCSEPLQ